MLWSEGTSAESPAITDELGHGKACPTSCVLSSPDCIEGTRFENVHGLHAKWPAMLSTRPWMPVCVSFSCQMCLSLSLSLSLSVCVCVCACVCVCVCVCVCAALQRRILMTEMIDSRASTA